MKRLVLCVGAAKSGTTWLYRNLEANRGLHFTPEKELNWFFSRHGAFDRLTPTIRYARLEAALRGAAEGGAEGGALDWRRRFAAGPPSDDWYRGLFAGIGPDRWAADFSPSTSLIRDEGWAAIARFAPEVRLIYILREPEARLWSHAKFHAWFAGEADRFRAMTPPEQVKYVERCDLAQDGDYADHLGRILRHVPRDRLLLLDYGRIEAEPEGVLREVEAFLDAPETPPRAGGLAARVNVSEALAKPEGFGDLWRERFRRQIDGLLAHDVAFARPWADMHARRPVRRRRPLLSRLVGR